MNHLYIWQDGGLKSKQNLGTFNMALQKVLVACPASHLHITLCFFAPHHGHSICDSHFSVVKRQLRAQLSGSLLDNKKVILNTITHMPNCWAFDLTPTLIESTSGDVAEFSGIRQYFLFELVSHQCILVKKLPTEPWEQKTITTIDAVRARELAVLKQTQLEDQHHFEKPVLHALRYANIVGSTAKTFTVKNMRAWLRKYKMPVTGCRTPLIKRIRAVVVG
ncbi:hypothetical protein Pelo_6073 [Pelomyxa schiedti]|nr:hypothetical protein Pelo_6073 [Pelomyxa schiedti]